MAPSAHAKGWTSVEVYSGFDYSAGHYGGPIATDILYIPLTIKYDTGPWTLRASTAYVHVDGPSNVIGAGENTTFVANLGTTGRFRRSGLSDTILGVTYSLPPLWRTGLFVDLTGKVKLPTASTAKALGTGKTDFTAQIDVAKALGRFIPFGTVAYRVIGRPKAYPLRNAWNLSGGLQYSLTRRINIGFSYDYRQSASPQGTDPRELFSFVSVGLGDKWGLELYGVAGLSDGSPDAAGGMQITFRPH